jgi:hypothetical protein
MTCVSASPTQLGPSLPPEALKRFSFFDRLFHSREASVEMCEYDRNWGGELLQRVGTERKMPVVFEVVSHSVVHLTVGQHDNLEPELDRSGRQGGQPDDGDHR